MPTMAGGSFQAQAPVGIQYRVGAAEHAKAAFMVPPAIAACVTDGAAKGLVVLGDTLRCVANNLWPNPVPTATYVYGNPTNYVPVTFVPGPVALPAAPPLPSSPCAPR
jgi:hypothetical protein